MPPEVSRIELVKFPVTHQNIGSHERGLKKVYEPDTERRSEVNALRIETDTGITGEFVGVGSVAAAQIESVAPVLIGKNPLERERIWTELRQIFRQNYISFDLGGLSPIDIALWDLAGKQYGAPIHELLGTYRRRLPAYASTYMGDENGGLSTPEAYADFAEACRDIGYPAFKIHGWIQDPSGGARQHDIKREIETVNAVADRVGDDMDLMLDPACEYETLGEAIKVGRACENNDYFWFEDPYKDGGSSHLGHQKLRELLDIPILQTEFVRKPEAKMNFLLADATDFLRVDPGTDGGITGAMKVARAAETCGIDVEVHGASPPQRHCMAAMRNTNYYEMSLMHPSAENTGQLPVYNCGYTDTLEAVDENGTVPVPDEPGLGVEYDWDLIRETEISSRVFE